MNKSVFWGILMILAFGSSCSEDRLYEDYIPLDNVSGWNQNDSLRFELGEVVISGKTSLLAIRFTDNYPFSNFYVRILAKDSSNQILENKLINVPLFDSKTGEPLGEGFGSTYTKYDTLPIQFKPGTNSLTLLQYMRQETLPGIEAAGIKILP